MKKVNRLAGLRANSIKNQVSIHGALTERSLLTGAEIQPKAIITPHQLIVVLGMHRSGTSAITRSLQVLGVNLGDKLMAPMEGNNDKGFWEDLDIVDFNSEVLKSINSDWHFLTPITTEDLEKLRQQGFYLKALELLSQKTGTAPVFGIKDPRFAKLLPFWQAVIAHSGCRVSYILTVRNPLSVVKSLAQRDRFDHEKSYFLWLDHVLASLAQTAGEKRVLVDYDRLMQDPERELARMAEILDLEIDMAELQIYTNEFLDKKLQHTVYNPGALLLDDACPPLVREIYLKLMDVVTGKISIDDVSLQNQIILWRNEFDRLVSTFRFIDKLYSKTTGVVQMVLERDGHISGLNHAVAERDRKIEERDGQISGLNQTLTELKDRTLHLTSVLAERNKQIEGLGEALSDRDAQIANLNQTVAERDNELAVIYRSKSWKLTSPLRSFRRTLVTRPHLFFRKHFSNFARWLWRSLPLSAGFRQKIKNAFFRNLPTFLGWARAYRDWKQFNTAMDRPSRKNSALLEAPVQKSVDDPPSHENRNNYQEWIRRYDTLTDQLRSNLSRRAEELSIKPLISVVMPTYNPKPEWLIEAIESVRNQIYSNWELCIADDASTDSRIRPILERYVREDGRIKVVIRAQNGHISAATNSALELATGEWVALLDHDDLLSEQALFWVAETITENANIRLIYSDEDKIDETGKRFDPYFKCDWNADLFYSHNMISHLGVYRSDLLNSIGGFREGLEGSQDYDLALRCIELIQPSQIHHIPRVLYHWRMHAESTAQSATAKPYALLAGEMALNEHFQRKSINAKAELLDFGMYRIRYELPNIKPLVSIIIPTRNKLELIHQCVESVLKKTTYPNYDILIIDNGSDDFATLQYFNQLKVEERVKVVRDDRPFNYSALNNSAVKLARGDVVALLNNDIEIISPDWLSEMVSHAIRPNVGAVGAKLWYPNDTLQHGGVLLGVGGVANHAHLKIKRGMHGYFGRASLIQEMSAVTAACLVIRKSSYMKVGGLNEVDLQVAFNDIDFCLRVREAGYHNIWTPYAELYHHESASRGYEDTPEKRERFAKEVRYMKKCWGEIILNDPAYNPNLTLAHTDFSLAWPPRLDSRPA